MMKLSIDRLSSQLPLKKAKGTVQQRLQKAIDINDKFFDSIEDDLLKKDVTTIQYKRKLKKAIGAPISIEIEEKTLRNSMPKGSETKLCIQLNDEMQQGYGMVLPLNFFTKRISGRNVRYFMHENLHVLERILNPKYNARNISMLNKGYDMETINSFFLEKIYTKELFKAEDLNKFLKGKKTQEKIDTLQHFRYSLLLEKHAHEYVNNNIQKFSKVLLRGEGSVGVKNSVSDYHFDEKLKILEAKLAEVIDLERAKTKTIVL